VFAKELIDFPKNSFDLIRLLEIEFPILPAKSYKPLIQPATYFAVKIATSRQTNHENRERTDFNKPFFIPIIPEITTARTRITSIIIPIVDNIFFPFS